MSNPTKENIATVMNGFAEFFNRMTQTQNFNLKEFVNFMEPRFKAAGYRDKPEYNARNVAGGRREYFNLDGSRCR